jgi:hypothetical protein
VNEQAPFLRSDLDELGEFLALADRVVPMYDIARGDTGARTIGLRHDVDDNQGSLDTALELARWEFEHGFSSTYYLLHGSYYWGDEMLMTAEKIEELGHEVGIHVNALAEALRTGLDPRRILRDALTELRTAVRVTGCVAHGDPLCHRAFFINDEMFSESARADCGAPDRELNFEGQRVRIQPAARGDFGLEYDANWLHRGDYVSDSGGRWSQRFEDVTANWPEKGQLHMLVHPDWWAEAFAGVRV